MKDQTGYCQKYTLILTVPLVPLYFELLVFREFVGFVYYSYFSQSTLTGGFYMRKPGKTTVKDLCLWLMMNAGCQKAETNF